MLLWPQLRVNAIIVKMTIHFNINSCNEYHNILIFSSHGNNVCLEQNFVFTRCIMNNIFRFCDNTFCDHGIAHSILFVSQISCM